ncbi:hypothetical protein EBF04_26780 [Streptomyces sp. I6]|nr:hypothetical protein EBF04_26780 [Streptomyces sp. I6]
MPIRVHRMGRGGEPAAAPAAASPASVPAPRTHAHAAASRESGPGHGHRGATRGRAPGGTRPEDDSGGRNGRVTAGLVRPGEEPARHGRNVPAVTDTAPYYSCCGRGTASRERNDRPDRPDRADRDPATVPLDHGGRPVPRSRLGSGSRGPSRSGGRVGAGARSVTPSAGAAAGARPARGTEAGDRHPDGGYAGPLGLLGLHGAREFAGPSAISAMDHVHRAPP